MPDYNTPTLSSNLGGYAPALSAIVLAAGMSRRMGASNKLLLPFGHSNMLNTIVGQIVRSGVEEIIVVCGYEADRVRASLEGRPVRIVENPDYEQGMTTSIKAGAAAATGKGYMICLSDMPMLEASDYQLIGRAFSAAYTKDPHCICVPQFEGKKGNPVVFSAAYRLDILENEEMEGCKNIVQRHKDHIYWVEMPSARVLADIDNPDDYRRAQAQADETV